MRATVLCKLATVEKMEREAQAARACWRGSDILYHTHYVHFTCRMWYISMRQIGFPWQYLPGSFPLGRLHANCTSLHPPPPLTSHPPNATPAHVRILLSYSEDRRGSRGMGLGPRPSMQGLAVVCCGRVGIRAVPFPSGRETTYPSNARVILHLKEQAG